MTALCPPFLETKSGQFPCNGARWIISFFIADFNIFIAWRAVKQHECPSSSCWLHCCQLPTSFPGHLRKNYYGDKKKLHKCLNQVLTRRGITNNKIGKNKEKNFFVHVKENLTTFRSHKYTLAFTNSYDLLWFMKPKFQPVGPWLSGGGGRGKMDRGRKFELCLPWKPKFQAWGFQDPYLSWVCSNLHLNPHPSNYMRTIYILQQEDLFLRKVVIFIFSCVYYRFWPLILLV